MTAPTQPRLPALRVNATARGVIPKSTEELLRQIIDPYGVYCVLELRIKAGESIFHLFPVMPEALNVAQRYLQTITPTQGGLFVDEYGNAPSPITLQGTFGRSPKMGLSMGQAALLANPTALGMTDAVGTIADLVTSDPSLQMRDPVTGYKLVKMLGEMVDLSHMPDPDTGELPTVRFYNFAWGASYEVALTNFSAQMSVQRNNLWQYSLEMVVLRRIRDGFSSGTFRRFGEPARAARAMQRLHITRLIENKLGQFNVGNLIERFTPPFLQEGAGTRELLQRTFDAVEITRRATISVTGAINSVRGLDVISYASGVLDNVLGLNPGSVGQLVNTVRTLPQLIGGVEAAIGSATRRVPAEIRAEVLSAQANIANISSVTNRYLENYNATLVDAGPTGAALATLGQTPPELEAVVALAEMALTVQESLDTINVLLAVNGMENAASTSITTTIDSAPEAASANSQQYRIVQNDTLAKIAQRFYGDENAWPTIAAALNSAFSDITPTEPLNLHIGTVISVPAPAKISDSLVPDVFDLPTGERAFGRDLPETLQVQTRPDGTQELVVLSEYETLLQGIIHRLQTPEGSIADSPEYGAQLPGLVGQEFGSLNEAMNAAKVEEALRNEPRLQAVNNVRTLQEQDTLLISFNAVARNAGSLGDVNLTLSRQSP